ncbi:hypothetical protein [Microbacter margulisiae]|uniref:Lipoprotein n=1 Tax=Microbacter margulisiae TaxID=1350067 RepID=A0A7W5H294_9PORP|nr:hypothetical protein [Microbacter margulisiae]MBB3187399.1 hypothetical protein [Microbacter margulisiae]
MRTFFLLCCSALLAACTQYQYITLNSNIYKADNQSFVWENDSVKVQYVFSGADCPVTIQVYNKSAQPIYVDWKKSAVIYSDGSRLSLWNDEVYINTVTTGAAIHFRNYSLSGSETGGVANKKEQVSFIPPNSYVSVTPMSIRSTFILPLPQQLKHKVPFGSMQNSRVDQYSFEPGNSPFTFRCFLTLSADEGFSHPIYIDQPFWVSNIIQTTISPSDVYQASNMFYVSRTTVVGHIMGGVGTVAVIAGAAYLDATTTPPPPHEYRHRYR